MYMYRIETYSMKKAEEEMNKMSMEGWRVIAVMPNTTTGFGLIVTFEKEIT